MDVGRFFFFNLCTWISSASFLFSDWTTIVQNMKKFSWLNLYRNIISPIDPSNFALETLQPILPFIKSQNIVRHFLFSTIHHSFLSPVIVTGLATISKLSRIIKNKTLPFFMMVLIQLMEMFRFSQNKSWSILAMTKIITFA